MKIDNTASLVRLIYDEYNVAPFKYFNEGFSYQCEPEEANMWYVMAATNGNTFQLKLMPFREQDEAHQFAELLTICLSQIKAFQNEHQTQQ